MMTFRKRFLRILYGFAGIACAFLIIVYSVVAGNNQTQETYDVLVQNATNISNSYSSIIETSNNAINLVLSEPVVLKAIRNLSTGKTENLTTIEKYYSDEYITMRERINLYFLYRNCYRVIFFNDTGDVVASNYSTGGSRLNSDVDIKNIPGISDIKEGEIIVNKAHEDHWNSRTTEKVISVVKRLAGNNMGYFEIQWLESEVENLLITSDDKYDAVIYDNSGNAIYSSKEDNLDYFNLVYSQSNDEGYINDGSTLLGYRYQDGYYTVVSTELHFWYDVTLPILPALLFLVVVFLGISFLFANTGAEALSKPINTLQKAITRTDYENLLQQTISDKEKSSLREVIEIDSTYEIFERMIERLDESKKTAEKMSYLQLKAQVDLMQAQVNPHFIYNVLNIISAKGLMADDESICDMCDNLSNILRYSTNVKEKVATVKEEIEYLQEYLMLLKSRYENRLEYHIALEPEIENQKIPKLALQQIVENAITHGFADNIEVLRIEIEGKENSKGWEICIRDNGVGIEKDNLDLINKRIEKLRSQLSDSEENIEFEIGGMGIYNTFSRLYLLYGEQLMFIVRSDDTGTFVRMGVGRIK